METSSTPIEKEDWKTSNDPEAWKATIELIVADMGIQKCDQEAINLISLVMQQEVRTLLKATLDQSELAKRSRPSLSDARVACQDYLEHSHVHPHLFEDNIRGVTKILNSQPFPETLQNPSLCCHFNLAAPTWKFNEFNNNLES